MTTARDWQRRFQVNALMMVTALVAVAVHLDTVSVLLSAAGHETVALVTLGAVWDRARRRFGERTRELWRFWSFTSGGHALGPREARPIQRRPERIG